MGCSDRPDPERWADEVAHERRAAERGFPGGGGGSSSGGGPNCLLTLVVLALCWTIPVVFAVRALVALVQ